MERQAHLYRELPSVDELLRTPAVAILVAQEGQTPVADVCRTVLAQLRREIAREHLDAEKLTLALSGIADAIRRELHRTLGFSLRPVINATGVILHTNLGRAPVAVSVVEHIRETATNYSNLEFDLSAGERGKRDLHVERLFQKLLISAGEDGRDRKSIDSRISTIVVNNNAAAVLLALNTLGESGEVIVSRGELVEIGGSFRIPDVMSKSGAVLREVGTTNRTRIADYERAITDRTRLLLKVHRSNFQIVGFAEEPTLEELVALGRKHN